MNPTVVIEVLSPTTESFDRGDKAAHYRRRASLKAYVLVSTSEQRIEVFVREGDGRVLLSEASPGESVSIAPIACSFAVDEIYADPLAGHQPATTGAPTDAASAAKQVR